MELKNSYYIFMWFSIPVFIKSYIKFLFNIKNNSIYISERIEKGCFVLKTNGKVLDTQLQLGMEIWK